MSTIKHKFRGTATIVGREGNRVRIKYDSDGYETTLLIPDSFTLGMFEIDEELQREVNLVVEAKREAERIKRAERDTALAQEALTKSVGVKANRTPKTPAKVKIKGAVDIGFEEYLIASEYSVQTPSGAPSTVAEYINAVDVILDDEGLSWANLPNHIGRLVSLYGDGGAKEAIGKKRKSININALRRFLDFVNNSTL